MVLLQVNIQTMHSFLKTLTDVKSRLSLLILPLKTLLSSVHG